MGRCENTAGQVGRGAIGATHTRCKWHKLLAAVILCVFMMACQGQAAAGLDKTKATVRVGATLTLKLNMKGLKKGQKLKWSVSNEKVLRIKSRKNGKAVFKAQKAGKATVTVKIGKRKFRCKVTVKRKAAKTNSKSKQSTNSSGYNTEKVYNRNLRYSGVPATDYLIHRMLKSAGIDPATTENMSDDTITKKIYRWISKSFVCRNDPAIIKKIAKGYKRSRYYNTDLLGKEIEDFREASEKLRPEGKVTYDQRYFIGGYMTGKSGNKILLDYLTTYLEYRWGYCDQIAAVFALMCNHAGVRAGIACGTTGDGSGHAWNWAKVNGKKVYFDLWLSCCDYVRDKKVSMDYCGMKCSKVKKMYKVEREY